jgi:hypothetical protein
VKVMEEGDESDLNRSREEAHLEGERSPSAGRTFAHVPVCVCGRGDECSSSSAWRGSE